MSVKIVDFHKYCPKCQHWEKKESEDPCYDCLNQAWNEDTHRPISFKEKENDK